MALSREVHAGRAAHRRSRSGRSASSVIARGRSSTWRPASRSPARRQPELLFAHAALVGRRRARHAARRFGYRRRRRCCPRGSATRVTLTRADARPPSGPIEIALRRRDTRTHRRVVPVGGPDRNVPRLDPDPGLDHRGGHGRRLGHAPVPSQRGRRGSGEDDWVRPEVQIGDAAFDVVKQIDRCVITTRPQPGGIERDLDVLRTINRDRARQPRRRRARASRRAQCASATPLSPD